MILRYTILFLISLVGFESIKSQDSIPGVPFLDVRGYLKALQNIYFTDDLSSLTSSNLIHNRLNFKLHFSPVFSGRLEIRNRIFWGEQIGQVPGYGDLIDEYNGVYDLSVLWVNDTNLVIHSVLDRALIEYGAHRWNVRLGRQRINWGINTIWNPLDIFNAFNILDFDYEERPGNDAIRIQHFFKSDAAAEVAWKLGRTQEEHIAAFLYKFNTSRYDFQFLGGVYYKDIVVGTGWAGNIKDAGFKGEISYFHPQEHAGDTTGTLSASLMVDQTFKNNWYLSASVLYNSQPSANIENYTGIYNQELSPKALSPYQYTIYAGANKMLSPITSLNISVIYSPTYASLILFPTFIWNIANNFDINLVGQFAFADQNGQYKTQGNAIFLRTKWSF